MGWTYTSRVESFPRQDSVLHENLLQVCRHISADHLSEVLDAALDAQKMGMKQAISPNTALTESDCHFINCYLDSTILLLDACSALQLRLENIRRCIGSIPIGLHCLEGEHEPSRAVLQKAASALESSCVMVSRYGRETEISMPNLRSSGKKLRSAYQDTNDQISPEFYRALSGSWTVAVLAVGEINSAISLGSKSTNLQHTAKPQKMLKNELSKKMKLFPKKMDEIMSMEELKEVDIVARTLLKLVLALQKAGGSGGSIIRRMAVKAVAEKLRMKTDQLEKTLPELKEKIGELYRLIIALRMSILGLQSEVQKEEDSNPANLQEGRNWAKFRTKLNRRASSLGRIGTLLQFIKN
ncbi:hypothetical protein KSP40_PGU020835 [Platanthera guangdongensis]|uniref:Uncharacterized protein n=1 Tax=Platanthera guangdongensis TaxID=2320717 RepID=A0ABR2M3N9_9ASPA